ESTEHASGASQSCRYSFRKWVPSSQLLVSGSLDIFGSCFKRIESNAQSFVEPDLALPVQAIMSFGIRVAKRVPGCRSSIRRQNWRKLPLRTSSIGCIDMRQRAKEPQWNRDCP